MFQVEDRSKVVKTAFKMLDLDRDGFITKEEFIQVHISTFQMNYGAQFLYELWRKDSLIYPPHLLHIFPLVSGVKDVG